MSKHATPDHPIHELIAKRWSPYAFADKPVSHADLRSLFEAARWSPSSYNEQPWSFIVATKEEPDAFEKVLSCLVEGNQEWAKQAPVLALTVARLTFQRNGNPNKAAIHDIGLAAAHLTFEATKRGIAVHQMIGIEPDKVRKEFDLPEHHSAVTGIAIGYLGEIADLPDKLRERDEAPRTRKPLGDFVFSGAWKQKAEWV